MLLQQSCEVTAGKDTKLNSGATRQDHPAGAHTSGAVRNFCAGSVRGAVA